MTRIAKELDPKVRQQLREAMKKHEAKVWDEAPTWIGGNVGATNYTLSATGTSNAYNAATVGGL